MNVRYDIRYEEEIFFQLDEMNEIKVFSIYLLPRAAAE